MARMTPDGGSSSGYGYMGGGFYVPTPYTPPKKKTIAKKSSFPKKVTPKKSYSSGSESRGPQKSSKPIGIGKKIEKKATSKVTPISHAVEKVRAKQKTPNRTPDVPRTEANRAKYSGEYSPVHAEAPAPYGPGLEAPAPYAAGAQGSAPGGGYDTGAVGGDGSSTQTGTGQATGGVAEGNAAGNLGAPTTPETPAEPTQVSVPSALADPTYILQLGALNKARARALEARDTAKDNYATQYGTTLHNLGYDQANKSWMANDNTSQYGQSFRGNMEDYGARGMLYSTGYAQDLADMNQQYNNQFDALNTAKSQYDTNQDSTYQDYLDQSSDQQTAALTAAAGRIASKYGVDPNQVNQDNKNTTWVKLPATS